ncbi:hypothetical protein IGX29_24570 [Streptomyces sp. H28]|uniref:hypothetical protein n=1 Tax=Streptomyces sp. H28 TaxID=2775865 RepID=UPI001783C9E4|nr:hypothetical protein [Streptomyces sp. H28]MBD9734923.1 hypothetical protein [Streptomyces sp. H28]
MTFLSQQSWAEAIGMYARRYSIAKVTGRRHEDWALDVLTLMRGDSPDVRGWQTVDFHEADLERQEDPYYPFVLLPGKTTETDEWKSRLHEIPRPSAERFLVTLSTQWLDVEKEHEFELRKAGLQAKAAVVLSRFPEGSRFYANTGPKSAQLDYYQKVRVCSPVSRHDWDMGLILVSESEVGMVWSFDPK